MNEPKGCSDPNAVFALLAFLKANSSYIYIEYNFQKQVLRDAFSHLQREIYPLA